MNKNKLLWVFLLLLLTILLAACGGSSSADEIAVGNLAPDFSLTDSDGKTVALADFKGQPVLLFFHMAGG